MRLEDFKQMGIYEFKENLSSDLEIKRGRIITNLPAKTLALLRVGGNNFSGDFSRQDFAAITSLLSLGHSPEDVYSTFRDSPRGHHAAERKSGHFDDYVQRTIKKAVAFLKVERNGHSNGNGYKTEPNGAVHVNFSNRKPEVDLPMGLIGVRANTVEVEQPKWIWPKYLPAGKLTVLAGDPGLGKSSIAIDLVSRITQGTFLPLSEQRTGKGTCFIASAEDASEDTIVPRLISCKADLARVEIFRRVNTEDGERYMTFPRDINRLKDKVSKCGARIVVIDPLNAFLSKETDSHRDQDVRLVLAPFEDMAEELQVCILIIAHLNKKEDSSTIYRIGGSIGIVGAARSVLAVTELDSPTKPRVIYSIKSSLSKKPPALEYQVRNARTVKEAKEWKGEEIVRSSKIRWMGIVDFDMNKKAIQSKEVAVDSVKEFLQQIILDAPVHTDEIFREAKKAGVSTRQILGSKDSLGIKSLKKPDGWYWSWKS
jgi:archaellum biogenesis ATPase FlaH